MTYQIVLDHYGAECVAGVLPDKIWQYIQDECEGDKDIYIEKLDEGEVPEEFRIASDSGSFYDAHEVCGSYVFWHEYGPYDSALTVYDEDGHKEIMTIEAKDLPSENSNYSVSTTDVAKGKPYFVWTSEEKGTWHLESPIETDEPFDKSKLKLFLGKLTYNNGNSSFEYICGIEYDGEYYEIGLVDSTGKGYDTDFYQDEV